MRAGFIKVMIGAGALAAFGIILPHGAAEARDDELAEQSVRHVIAGFETAATRMDTFRPLIDRSRFDAMEAVEALDFDGDGIAMHVAGQVRYEPYDGILRGAQATLSSGAGNALDQSLLLLELLQAAGYDAQILRVDEIPSELAEALAQAAFSAPGRAAAVTDPDEAAAWLRAAAGEIGGAQDYAGVADAFTAAEPEAVGEQVAEVAAALFPDASASEAAIKPESYHWVRYRMASGMPWTETHPALGGADFDGLRPDTVLTGDAAEDMLHFLTVELFAEILENDALSLAPVMSPWRQPVATLLDRPLTLSMAVDRPEGGTAGASFTPMLDGRTAPGAMMTTLGGVMVDQGVLSMDSYGMSGIFSTMGEQLQDGAGLVAGRDEDRPVRAATGLMLRVTWTKPDGGERVEERWILDRLANRFEQDEPPRLDLSLTREEALDRLNFSRSITVNPGGAHDAFALDRTAEALGRRARHLAALLEAYDARTGEFDAAGVPSPVDSGHIPALTQMLSALDAPLAWPEGRSAFRHGPLVISLHMDDAAQHCEDSEPGRITAFLDVLMNPWTGIAMEDRAIRPWPQGAVIRGVRDTAVEVEHAGVSGAWDYLDRHGVQARPAGAADVAEWPQDARLAAERDLAEGFSLVALPAADPDAPLLWWRVGAEGEVLGRHARGGFAQTYTERGTLDASAIRRMDRIGNVISAVSYGNSVRQCFGRSGAMARACCITAASATALAGHGLGNGMGSGFANAMFPTWGQILAGMAVVEAVGELGGRALDHAVCSPYY